MGKVYKHYVVELLVSSDVQLGEDAGFFGSTKVYIPVRHYRDDLDLIKVSAVKAAQAEGYTYLGEGVIYAKVGEFKDEMPDDPLDFLKG